VVATEFVAVGGRAYRFRVEAKTATGTFTTIVDRTANTQVSPNTDTLSTPTKARFIRLTVTGVHAYSGGWVSVRELKVLGY